MAKITRAVPFIYILMAIVSGEFNLTILHTNDIHAHFEQFDKYGGSCSDEKAEQGECYGGIPRLSTAIKQIRDNEDNVLLLDGGDVYQGTIWFTYYGGYVTQRMMSNLAYNTMTLGNHEFDKGLDVLASYLRNMSSIPFVCSNIDVSNEPVLAGLIQPSTIVTVGDQQIGIVGYITKSMPELIVKENRRNVLFLDEITSVRAEVENLKSQGIDKIIALGHAGFSVDRKIAEEVDGVDIVIGGHSNTFLYTGDPPSNDEPYGPYPTVVGEKQVLVVQDFHFAKYLGYLNVVFDDNGKVVAWKGNPILLDNSFEQDEAILGELMTLKSPIIDMVNLIVAQAYMQLGTDRYLCQWQECIIGRLATDAIVDYFVRDEYPSQWTNASICVMNGGAIRSSLSPGLITYSDLLSVFPFGNEIVQLRMKGKDFRSALEHSVSGYSETDPEGRFLQMSGVKVEYDVSRDEGDRVVSVQVLCNECLSPVYEELQDDKIYPLLTNYYLSKGGDGYDIFRNKAIDSVYYGELVVDVFHAYLKKQEKVYTRMAGNIRFSGVQTDCLMSPSDANSFLPDLRLLILSLLIILFGFVPNVTL